MIVNRRTFVAQRGRMQEALALLKEALAKVGETMDSPITMRFYSPEFGAFDVFAVEMEYEDWDEYHEALATWKEMVSEEFWEKWYTLTEGGGANEMWNIFE